LSFAGVVMRQFLLALVFAAGAFIAAPAPAGAACLTCSCTVSADPMSFGAFSPLAGPVEAVGAIDVDCIGLTTSLDSISIELSTGISGSYAPRQLRSGPNSLAYNLYTDPARTIVWGDGTQGSSPRVVQNQLSLLMWSTTAPVYGRVQSSPLAPPGAYSDTIIVTVEW
jgi:spore coat protein U-like protein